jgi:5-methylcytosine-specific restriction endonuclease McrA
MSKCVECGSAVTHRQTCRRQPNTCSEQCRKSRKRKTHDAWVIANHAKVAAYQAEYRKAYRDENPEYFREYYAANKARRKREAREWYSYNAAHATEVAKKYVASRPEWRRTIGRKSAATRRARKKELFIEVVDHRKVFERDKGICGICGMSVGASRWEIDHIVPLAAGGVHAYDNVQLSHQRCNRAKGAKVAA